VRLRSHCQSFVLADSGRNDRKKAHTSRGQSGLSRQLMCQFSWANVKWRLVMQAASFAGLSSFVERLRADRVWTLEEIVTMTDGYMPAPKPRGGYKKKPTE